MSAHNESELSRTLKQVIELHSLKQQGRTAESVTLFGKRLSVGASSSSDDDSAKLQPSEKLPPTTILHLKELYEQHLKRKALCPIARHDRNGDTLTLPLLGTIHDTKSVGVKRQRVGSPESFSVSGSQPASFEEAPHETHTEKESPEVAKEAPLTLFYNGMVYVFDDITEDMAQAIMILAGNATASTTLAKKNATNVPIPKETKPVIPMRPSFSLIDLPQARKASLHRFLEKRKDRLFASSDMESFSSKSALSKPGTPPRSPPPRKIFAQQQRAMATQAQLQIH